jgi:UDP-glucuronate 4-epimerase
MNILVTGVAGFIGYFVAQRLLDMGHHIIGADNLNNYYDIALKEARLDKLRTNPGFSFFRINLEDVETVQALFKDNTVDTVIHLAAQAGVRYSLKNPAAYVQSNLVGFANILEGCRTSKVNHLVFASSSSVYGANTKTPFSETDFVDNPVSLYAATKKSNELMAHSYAHLFSIPCTGLRFFTVYGPWGRPDMAYFSFTKAIIEGTPISVFNSGKMSRDFTYIDDIVEGVIKITDCPPEKTPSTAGNTGDYAKPPYRILNIGNNRPVELLHFINVLETAIGKKAQINLLPMQPGDVPTTYANIDLLRQIVDFSPATPIEIGLPRFVDWYRGFYRI